MNNKFIQQHQVITTYPNLLSRYEESGFIIQTVSLIIRLGLRSVKFANEPKTLSDINLQSELEQSPSHCDSLEYWFTKISSFLEDTTPDIWNKTSYILYEIVEDHRKNLVPHYRKYGCEWIATCITSWSLFRFVVYFAVQILRTAIIPRRL